MKKNSQVLYLEQFSAKVKPFVGASPVTGESEPELTPEEIGGTNALLHVSKTFFALVKTLPSSPPEIATEFVEGLHWAHLSLGTIRLHHTMNQEYRKQQAAIPTQVSLSMDTPLTDENTLVSLEKWAQDFEKRIILRCYAPEFKAIADTLVKAWRQMLLLLKQYPDQQGYHEFITGITQCEDALNRLHLEACMYQGASTITP